MDLMQGLENQISYWHGFVAVAKFNFLFILVSSFTVLIIIWLPTVSCSNKFRTSRQTW